MDHILQQKAKKYLTTLCIDIPERAVGSKGNLMATSFFKRKIASFGWKTETPGFKTIDWKNDGVVLQAGQEHFEVFASPYSLGCMVQSQLAVASSIEELEKLDARDKIILLHGTIAKEQLMPKNFIFYNPEHHQKIVSILEKSGAQALICATGRNSSLAGGAYPFPLLEDGDFDIPSVYITEEEGARLLSYTGKTIILQSRSKRIPSKSYNVIGRKGKDQAHRIVITAHIDAKKGTPGAIDNATGVIVLLLLAEMLEKYNGDTLLELVALNGEDYYAVPGQMNYITANHNSFNSILLNINIDGAGYKNSKSVFSFFNPPDDIKQKTLTVLKQFPGITQGIPWPQGDHSIFLHYGIPAIAITSEWFLNNIDTQDITHTPKDNSGIVDCTKLVEIAEAIKTCIKAFAT